MATNDLSVDYQAVLADLKTKRDKLNAAIAGIEVMLGISSSASIAAPSESGTPGNVTIESDTFFNLSTPDAVRKYLRMSKKPKTTSEITAALEQGGFTHQSDDFANTVGAILARLASKQAGISKVARATWGLSEWYGSSKKAKKINGQSSTNIAPDAPDDSEDDELA